MSRSVLLHARAVLALAAAVLIAAGLAAFQAADAPARGWPLLGLGMALAFLGQLGVVYDAPQPLPPALASTPRRRWLGAALLLCGALLWAYGTAAELRSWVDGFDTAWRSWPLGALCMAIGADLAWGRWRVAGADGTPRRPWWRRHAWLVAAVVGLVAVAALYRLGNIADFPGEAAATQVEDFQVGNFGKFYLLGERVRWEYLSSTWLAALGIALGGYTQLAMRVPFAVVSALKLVPMFLWARLLVGSTGALFGMALLAGSFWDVVLSRIPNNHNALVVAIAFSLLAGPARRGRPSAYIGLGLIGGYILHEYIAYRPLVVWALAGATWWSLRDRTVGWPARVARPLVVVALIASMIAPLFLTRLPGETRREYVDGWSRAHGQTGYYNPADGWREASARRAARAVDAAALFVYRGDRSPVRNIKWLPLVDPVTAALLLFGIAGALAHVLQPILLLTLLGFLVHVGGTLIATGNFDVARVGGAVAYVYVLAAVGAAGLGAAVGAAWGRVARRAVLLGLALALGFAAYWNTTNLLQLWRAPEVRHALRNPLAYLTVWLGKNLRPGERVLGVAPLYTNALEGHDSSWLMGKTATGAVYSDVESLLRDWATHPVPTLLFIYVGRTTEDLAAYFHWLFPELELELVRDPLEMGDDIAAVHVAAPPATLAERLRVLPCRGADASYALLPADGDTPLASDRGVAPFIDRSTWPDGLMRQVFRLAPQRVRVKYRVRFRIEQGGEYRFALDTYAGQGTLFIDGKRGDAHGFVPATLAAGGHDLRVDGDFSVVTPSMQLRWSGPETSNRQQLMPLYRLAEPKPDCPPPAPTPAAEPGPPDE